MILMIRYNSGKTCMDLIGFAPSPCFPHHQQASNSHSHCVSQREQVPVPSRLSPATRSLGDGSKSSGYTPIVHTCSHQNSRLGKPFDFLQNPVFVRKKGQKTVFHFSTPKKVGSRRHRYVYSVLHNLLTCFKYIAKHVHLFFLGYTVIPPWPPMAPHGMKSLLWLSPPLLRSLTYQIKPQALNPPPAREC